MAPRMSSWGRLKRPNIAPTLENLRDFLLALRRKPFSLPDRRAPHRSRFNFAVNDMPPAPQQGQLMAMRMLCFCSSSRSARSSMAVVWLLASALPGGFDPNPYFKPRSD